MPLHILERDSDELLVHVPVAQDHLSQVECRKLHHECVCERPVEDDTKPHQIRMRERDNLLLGIIVALPKEMVLNVDSVGVPYRDAVLLPPKFDVPRSVKRVGTDLKTAEILDHQALS